MGWLGRLVTSGVVVAGSGGKEGSPAFLSDLYGDADFSFSYGRLKFAEILRDLERFDISAQIYTQLKLRNKLDAVPSFFRYRLKRALEQALFQNLLIQNETDQILDGFEHCGVDVIPLKGIDFAKRYFGHLSARATSDIDLLIRASDYGQAADCVAQLGFLGRDRLKSAHYHAVFYKALPGQREPLAVELHWEIERPRTSDLKVAEWWEAANGSGVARHVRHLPLFETFYLICLHGVRHRMDSLKYAVDIAHLLYWHKGELDLERLLNRARQDRTSARIRAALNIVCRLIPSCAPSCPSVDRFRFRWLPWAYPPIGKAAAGKDSVGVRQGSFAAGADGFAARQGSFAAEANGFVFAARRDGLAAGKGGFKEVLFRMLFPIWVLDCWKHRLHLLWQLVFPPRGIAFRSPDGGEEISLIRYYIGQYGRRWNKYFG